MTTILKAITTTSNNDLYDAIQSNNTTVCSHPLLPGQIIFIDNTYEQSGDDTTELVIKGHTLFVQQPESIEITLYPSYNTNSLSRNFPALGKPSDQDIKTTVKLLLSQIDTLDAQTLISIM